MMNDKNGTSAVGLIGLAVMGQNLVLNMHDKGYSVSVYNRTAETTRAFLTGPARNRTTVSGYETLEDFVSSLEHPRKIMLMVKAGPVVDIYIEKLVPLLSPGDIIIDGGNSRYSDTGRRVQELEKKQILFIGCGVSGGEEGARNGPSLMPGGNRKAWPFIKEILNNIAAETESGEKCCDWMGEGGAGHYVKMVHNGIEYGDMQLICEVYHVMKSGLQLSADELHRVFSSWNQTELKSYLIEITSRIFTLKEDDDTPLVEYILDTAGQKGTGTWTGISALEQGIPVSLIVEAVFARALSALKEERMEASKVLSGPKESFPGDKKEILEHVRKALLSAKIISYAQGFMLLRAAAAEYGWSLDFGSIALVWREGCIIRSVFLEKIKEAFTNNQDLPNLLLDGYFKKVLDEGNRSLRFVVAAAVQSGIPVPALSSALSFYDGYRCNRLPANLLQAQRDYFGAHTYERTDAPRGKFFHTDWTGEGGKTFSGTYNA